MRKVEVRCDVVHPASGEIIAEAGDTFEGDSPRAQMVCGVVFGYPDHYDHRLEENVIIVEDVYQIEGCPTDKEIQLMQGSADQEEEERHQWANGRGYGNFPKEGL